MGLCVGCYGVVHWGSTWVAMGQCIGCYGVVHWVLCGAMGWYGVVHWMLWGSTWVLWGGVWGAMGQYTGAMGWCVGCYGVVHVGYGVVLWSSTWVLWGGVWGAMGRCYGAVHGCSTCSLGMPCTRRSASPALKISTCPMATSVPDSHCSPRPTAAPRPARRSPRPWCCPYWGPPPRTLWGQPALSSRGVLGPRRAGGSQPHGGAGGQRGGQPLVLGSPSNSPTATV